MLTIIVAVADQNAIGKDNRLLCHIPGDLKRFKEITGGHTVIMGRRTWESLPNRPLPNRRNIVLSDQPGETFEGAEMAYSIDELMGKLDPADEHFVIGGGMVYRQFLPLADTLLITKVYQTYDADAFFPEIPAELFYLVSEDFQTHHPDFQFSYQTWKRRS